MERPRDGSGGREQPMAVTRMRASVPPQLWALVAAAFVIAIGYGLIAPVLPTFAQSFDVGVRAASAAISPGDEGQAGARAKPSP